MVSTRTIFANVMFKYRAHIQRISNVRYIGVIWVDFGNVLRRTEIFIGTLRTNLMDNNTMNNISYVLCHTFIAVNEKNKM